MKRLPHRINEGLLYWIPFISSKWKMRKGKIAGREGMVNMQDFLPENRTSVRQKTNKKQNSWLDPSGANRINMPKYKLQVRKKASPWKHQSQGPPFWQSKQTEVQLKEFWCTVPKRFIHKGGAKKLLSNKYSKISNYVF